MALFGMSNEEIQAAADEAIQRADKGETAAIKLRDKNRDLEVQKGLHPVIAVGVSASTALALGYIEGSGILPNPEGADSGDAPAALVAGLAGTIAVGAYKSTNPLVRAGGKVAGEMAQGASDVLAYNVGKGLGTKQRLAKEKARLEKLAKDEAAKANEAAKAK